jgi:hypothetical protein
LGRNYRKHLDADRFSSVRQLAEAMAISHTWANNCLCLADLPPEVIAAFPDPHSMQATIGVKLARAVDMNAALILQRAEELRSTSDLISNPTTKRIADYLLLGQHQDDAWMPLSEARPELGDWRRKANGSMDIRVKAVSAETLSSIEILLTPYISPAKEEASQQDLRAAGN